MLVLAQRIGWWTSARIPSNPELPTRGHTRQKKTKNTLGRESQCICGTKVKTLRGTPCIQYKASRILKITSANYISFRLAYDSAKKHKIEKKHRCSASQIANGCGIFFQTKYSWLDTWVFGKRCFCFVFVGSTPSLCQCKYSQLQMIFRMVHRVSKLLSGIIRRFTWNHVPHVQTCANQLLGTSQAVHV